ncbi:MAG: methionyl-tRNA formyltransferase [Burkholderiaceae bacterium]
MRVVFAGTPEFAAVALRAICAAGWEVALVLTQPDRPAGRGMQVHESAVKGVARQHALPLLQPRSLKLDGIAAADAQACRLALEQANADAMVVAAYGLILPRWVLDDLRQPGPDGRARHGCINIHASLLPRWRGAAPIHRAIQAGDTRTGVCIMEMDEGLDTGNILRAADLPIQRDGPAADTTGTLHDRLARLGADMLVDVLRLAQQGPLQSQAQARDGVCYAFKVERQEARIDWSLPAAQLERNVRAFDPTPGAWIEWKGQPLKIWSALVVPDAAAAPPGQIVAAGAVGIDVACAQGTLRLLTLQRAGGRRVSAAEFLHGHGLRPGMGFGGDSGAA